MTDPQVRHSGPGPASDTQRQPGRSTRLSGRLALAIAVVVGQLWALAVAVDAWMQGSTRTAWWCTGFLGLSFAVVLVLWLLDPQDR
ncbi:hypothetical protein [Streptomyces sp. NPDC051776]|uniref:hypothetical protein n=1 Tax=Streptomyces sp. NPDC051776 TaxID=3155414 RepID=UPI0034205DD1